MHTEFRLFSAYSDGTLKLDGLIRAAVAAAHDLAKWRDDATITAELMAAANEAEAARAAMVADDDGDGIPAGYEQASESYSYLVDTLDTHCPPFVSFRSHEGDGACVGFFVEIDAIEDARRFGEIAEMDDEGNVSDPECWEAVHVTDHGNLSLHVRNESGEWRYVWGIV